MKIKTLRAWLKPLAIKRPYTIARNTFSAVEIVFLEIELYNGIIGLGSSSTDVEIVHESAVQTLDNLQSDKVLQLEGRDIREFHGLIKMIEKGFPDFPGTRAAIDMALHDAFCKWIGLPVVDYYGRHFEKLLTSVTIGIKDVSETLNEAQEYYEAGFRALKVKTGLDPALDAERIVRLRERYGNYFTIRVDANTGYDLTQLNTFMRLTDGQQVELIEQPFLPGMDKELLQLPAAVRDRLAADESLKDARAALTLSFDQCFGIFNIKLMKCGGITAAFDIATIARQTGIELFWGCNDESIVSITAALHAAFACPHTRYIDLDGSLDLAEDIVTGGFLLTGGYMYPNNQPGLGLKIISP